jgi:hypothetical protein
MGARLNAIAPLTIGNRPLPNPPPGASNSSGTFNPYAAGDKRYGAGRIAPNIGPTSDPLGYITRDNKAKAKKMAIQRRLAAQQGGDPNNPNL